MEETQREQQFTVFTGSFARVELVFSHQTVQALEVRFEALQGQAGIKYNGTASSGNVYFRWFRCHFNARLQDRDGKIRMRTGAEPHSETWVDFLAGLEGFYDFIQCWHPAKREMAVGEEHPVSFAYAIINHSVNRAHS